MPVQSLHSSVFKWPDAVTVDQAVRRWATEIASRRPEVVRIGYIGSYARGDWGVGSDLDLLIVVENATHPFWSRSRTWDCATLPVPTDLLIYTVPEWHALLTQGDRFAQTIQREAVWVYHREN